MYYQKKRWSNSKKSNYNGYCYDSNFEADYAKELDLRQKAGDIKSWERQERLHLVVNGYEVCTYKIDFTIYHNDGTIEYVELKGYPVTDAFRIKWKLFEALYSDKPDVVLTLIKQQNSWNIRKPKKIA